MAKPMSWERVKLRSVNLNENVREVVGLLTNLAPLWNDVPAVLLDLTSCGFLNAEGAAILAAFVVHRRTWGGSTGLDWDTASYDLKRQLGRWRLTELFGRENFPWTDNAIPLLHQERLDGPSVIEHISTVIRAGENMPATTPDLQREINKALCELFVNIFEHAGSACGGLAIGQYYPIKKQVQFCVCDVGVGLVSKVQSAGFGLNCCSDAIRWALQEGNSTKQGPNGLGLYLLQEFVKLNGGSLRILANTGHYHQKKAHTLAESLSVSFPGTLIQLGLLIRPGEVYTIRSRGGAS
jgi:anti-sigma regulatory factor (Ser/Thr protein kinase)